MIQNIIPIQDGLKELTDELEEKIKELETQWNLYHKDHKNHRMPNMQELAKLRSRRDEIKRMENK